MGRAKRNQSEVTSVEEDMEESLISNPVCAEHEFPPTRGSLDAAAESLLVYTLPAFV